MYTYVYVYYMYLWIANNFAIFRITLRTNILHYFSFVKQFLDYLISYMSRST